MKKWIVFNVFSLLFFCLKAQTFDSEKHLAQLKNPIPPSPNSSSLGKFGMYPVSLYTGVPSITIPLLEVVEGNIKMPISLNYHASGIKVGEVASWVGLGWSLNAGGVITRSIRGIADETIQYGYLNFRQSNYNNPTNAISGLINQTTLSYNQYLIDAANGDIDTEPDSYSFSALGQSFSFFFGSNGQIFSNAKNNIKITTNFLNPSVSHSEFYVTLEDGTKLFFGGQNYLEYTTDTRRGSSPSYVSSWVLRKIVLLNNSEINFSYTNLSIMQDTYFSESDYIQYKLDDNSCEGVKTSLSPKKIAERLNVNMLQLSRVETELQVIDFIPYPTEREDLKNGFALKDIIVKEKNTLQQINKYSFFYEYSNSVVSNSYYHGINSSEYSYYNKRLRLSNLQKRSINNDVNFQEWIFEYNSANLPSRRSYAQDYWGYYNGKNSNYSLLPNVYFQIPSGLPFTTDIRTTTGFMPNNHPHEIDKDANDSCMKAEILEKIVYPTGGYSVFKLEANRVNVTKERFISDTKNLQFNLSTASNPFQNTYDVSFTTTKPQYVYLEFNGNISQSILDERVYTNINARILNSNGVSVVGLEVVNQQSGGNGKWFNLLQAGTYTLRLTTNVTSQDFYTGADQVSASASIKYEKSLGVSSFDELVGGLRVKNIEEYDLISNYKTTERKFIYENPLLLSTHSNPQNFITTNAISLVESIPGPPGQNPTQITCSSNKVTRNSSANFALGTNRGGIVGYGKVTVLEGINSNNGKEINNFTNDIDIVNYSFPFVPNVSKESRRGLLLEQHFFNSSNNLLKSINNTYDFSYIQSITAIKAGYKNQIAASLCGQQPSAICNVEIGSYETVSEQIRKLQTTETTYDNIGNALTTSTQYFYDNPNNSNPTRTITTDSKGNTITNLNYSPLEKSLILSKVTLSTTASTAIDDLIAKNQLSVPVFTESTRGATLLNRSLINYKTWSSGLTLPENIQIKKGVSTLNTKILFNAYDTKGNILEQQKANDIPECYIWGYNNQYPVAKIVGTTYANATSPSVGLNMTLLNDPLTTDVQMRAELNKLRSLPNVFVTTYTYAPLIGITSETDPNNKTTYYEYDSFNRLKLVRDFNGNILKTFDYKYKQTY